MKLQDLKQLKTHVHIILTNQPKTRKDDFLLIKEVMKQYADTENESFDCVMAKHKEYGLPSFAGITRSRRKVQEENPSLKDEITTEIRKETEEVYVEFARDKGLDEQL